MRSTYIPGPAPRTRLVWNWSYIIASVGVGALLATLVIWGLIIATS